jgi:hypothetical protein
LFDASRAPVGKHVAWAYCPVPNGSTVDASAVIAAQIERAAPGFRETGARPHHPDGDRDGGVQPELRGRRYQWWRFATQLELRPETVVLGGDVAFAWVGLDED